MELLQLTPVSNCRNLSPEIHPPFNRIQRKINTCPKNAAEKVISQNKRLAIPKTSIDRYNQMPIATCRFSEDLAMVKVGIPVVSIGDFKVNDLRVVPFR